VQDYIKDLLTGDKKFVVFCHHKVMLNGIGKPPIDQWIQHFTSVQTADPDPDIAFAITLKFYIPQSLRLCHHIKIYIPQSLFTNIFLS
jgi:hypothetical protein